MKIARMGVFIGVCLLCLSAFIGVPQVSALTDIDTCVELQNITSNLAEDYQLTADIDCTFDTQNAGGALYNSGAGFTPIAWLANFTGSLDGNGHTITGLYINRPLNTPVSMFGNFGTLSQTPGVWDLTLTDFDITGHSGIGALVAVNNGATISNVHVVNATLTTNASGSSVGGIMSENQVGVIDRSSANVTITAGGSSWAGGLVGYHFGTITNSYSTGTITQSASGYGAGGIAGYSEGTMTNVYTTVDVTGDEAVGGIAGDAYGSTITNVYAVGRVIGNTSVGGFVGLDEGGNTYADSFWNNTINSDLTADGSGGPDPSGVMGKSTTALKLVATFTDLDTVGLSTPWDFFNNPRDDVGNQDIWSMHSSINSHYPFFRWQSAIDPEYESEPASSPTPTPTPTPTPATSDPNSTNTACSNLAPSSAPNLFQIDTTQISAKLYYAPVSGATGYYFSYGVQSGVEQYAAQIQQAGSSGVLTYTIEGLSPNTTYYFRLKAKNGCKPSDYGNEMMATTDGTTSLSPIAVAESLSSPLPSSESSGLTSDESSPESPRPSDTGVNQISTMPSVLASQIEMIREYFTEVATPENAEDFTHTTAAIAGTGAATIATASLVGTSLLVSRSLISLYATSARSLFNLPLDLVSSLGSWLVVNTSIIFPFLAKSRKKKSVPGIVYNALSRTPVSGAYTIFYSASGNLKTDFTDQWGKYYVEPVPDDYQIRVEHSLFSYPSKLATHVDNAYQHGQIIHVGAAGEVISSIPIALDPKQLALPLKVFHFLVRVVKKVLYLIKVPLGILVIITSTMAVMVNPSTLNIAISAMVALIWLHQLYTAITRPKVVTV